MNIDKIRKDVTEYCIRNRNSIINFDSMSDDDREHIYNIATSIILQKNKICSGGGFVNSIIDNDLEYAVSKADDVCIKALRLFVIVNSNFNIN